MEEVKNYFKKYTNKENKPYLIALISSIVFFTIFGIITNKIFNTKDELVKNMIIKSQLSEMVIDRTISSIENDFLKRNIEQKETLLKINKIKQLINTEEEKRKIQNFLIKELMNFYTKEELIQRKDLNGNRIIRIINDNYYEAEFITAITNEQVQKILHNYHEQIENIINQF